MRRLLTAAATTGHPPLSSLTLSHPVIVKPPTFFFYLLLLPQARQRRQTPQTRETMRGWFQLCRCMLSQNFFFSLWAAFSVCCASGCPTWTRTRVSATKSRAVAAGDCSRVRIHSVYRPDLSRFLSLFPTHTH